MNRRTQIFKKTVISFNEEFKDFKDRSIRIIPDFSTETLKVRITKNQVRKSTNLKQRDQKKQKLIL